ncbi:LysE family translocator [Photobacterium sanctipauli]|uniref:LysE family translocator n=1 Tax=Photobacterium sanctipauli TaxID=1342794 RepID=A0A2T3NYJ5_9GAMM|nr:LysE family translocator [Photobacterium sanctipauli]PSW21292.1 LysE family translocator [Photobacterium sanctipauli]
MSIDTWLAFVAASLVLTATPGPSIFLGIVHAINYGEKRVIYTALGDICANFIQMVLVAVGLGVIIASSELAFTVIKWLGAVTLFYMGIKMILGANKQISNDSCLPAVSNGKLFTSGFLVAAGNPKAIVFFTAFFPQFIDPAQPLFPQMAIMCPTMALLDFTLVLIYAFSANKVVKLGGAKLILVNKISGGLLVGLSGALATTSR